MRNAAARAAAAAAALAGVLAILTWQVIAAGPLTGADMPVYLWVLRRGREGVSPLWAPMSDLGDSRFGVPVLVVVAAIACWRLRLRAVRPVLRGAAAIAAFTIVVEVLKNTIGRLAPSYGIDAVFEGGTDFPSGHTFGATVIWGVAAWLAVLAAARTGLGPACASRYSCLTAGGVAGLATAAAMVRMGNHWVSDAVGGWLLGMIALLVIVAAESASRRLRPSRGLLHRNERRPDRDELAPEPPRPGRSTS